jgi:putative oxidoreductase
VNFLKEVLGHLGPLAGRNLIALIFVFSGFEKIIGFEATVGYIAAKGLPLAQWAALGAIVVELGGGIMLMVGWRARSAAAALFVFTALAAVIFHAFWAAPANQAGNQTIHFLKNVSIMGGLLYVMACGSGSLSLDGEKKQASNRISHFDL